MKKHYPFLICLFILLFGCKNAPQQESARDGSDIATARIAVMTGSTSAMFIETNYPQAQLLRFDDINDVFLAVKARKADYAFTSYITAITATKRKSDFVLLPEVYVKDPAGIAINKKDTALLRQINEILLRYKSDGTLNDLIARWIKTDLSNYQPEEILAVSKGKSIRVGIAASREPMCFMDKGKITGLDIELMKRIALELERPILFYDMKFSALIAAIASGKVDLIISNMSITPEREKRVNFSESYFVNPQILTTLAFEDAQQAVHGNWFSRVKESFINNLLVDKRYMMILLGLWQTIIITFFSIIFGTIVGGSICFLRMNRNQILVAIAKVYISVMRGTPIVVLLMIFFYIIFASSGMSATAVAIVTFALNMGAYSSEMFRTGIQSIDRGQTEAGIAMGFTKVQTFVFVVFPQALRHIIPVYKGEVISLLKMTSIVGYIAVVDLTKASDMIRARTFDAFFPLIVVAIIYFLLAWLMGLGLDKLTRKFTAVK
jgi:polar amino acid transport system substrate-binding protein